VKSIYFFDPNGLRLEYTCPSSTAEENDRYASQAHGLLREWGALTRDRSAR
jgi:hypothetical protein